MQDHYSDPADRERQEIYIAAEALLDELDKKQQYIKLRDQENYDIALTVGKLRVELEGKDAKIANLTAERDALREGEMGDAKHSNTRAAADIYFQLVEECEIPAGGSLVEYVDDMREKLEAAEKRIAEQSAIVAAAEKLVRCKGRYHSELNYRALAKLFGVVTPDLPPLEHENVHYADAAEVEITALRQRIAELEARKVNLSKLSVGEVMHMSGFSRDYAEGWCAGNDNAIHEIRTAGIKVKE
ncbi:TPA: ead/Ea22-like family protein [Salmonella enterica subsp. enterica serovar Newport]